MPAAKAKRNTRIPALKKLLKANEIEALYIRDLINIRYLTGFEGTYAILVVDQRKATLITDSRYGEIAQGMVTGAKVVIQPMVKIKEFFVNFFKKAGYKTIGFEGSLCVDEFDALKGHVRPSKAKLVKTCGLVQSLRAIKDEGELKLIGRAAKIADLMMARAYEMLKVGVKEVDLSREIRFGSELLGGSGESFANIVASGPNASRPHHHPLGRRFKKGDMITIDLGAIYGGYCSDMTRTPVLGKVDKKFEEIYNVCLHAQKESLKACVAGKTGGEVDAIARDIIASAGYGKYFAHGLGHSVGLEIHENPRLRTGSEEVLQPGHVVTVEPGIYIPGFGGVRIEDLVVVTKGKPKVLSRTPKELQVL
ncbi:Xaa-Pro peptidase family protein [bacterium]|nr:Xaa-Pro peptidase family protein [bacterium]